MAIAGRSYANTPVISRSSFQDVPPPTEPIVSADPPDRRWFATNDVTLLFNPQPVVVPSISTPDPIVVSAPNAATWFRPNQATVIVNPQPAVATATPDPIVVTPVDVRAWYRINVTNLQRNTLQDPPQLTTPDPVVSSSPAFPSWFKINPAQVLSNPQALVIPSVATPDPIVVSAPNALAWYKTGSPQLFDNPQAPAVIPGTSTPAPVVVSSTRAPHFLLKRPHLIRPRTSPTGPQPDTRTALQLGGTVGIPNLLGGTVSVVRAKAGSLTVLSPIAGTLTLKSVDGTATVSPVLAGSAVVVSPYSSSLVEWTMQEVDIVLAEFNDETVNLAITSSGSALNITGYTLEMYLKPVRGSADTATGVVKLSTATGEITITNGPGGLATVAIPASDFTSVNDIYTFYRVDTIDTNSKRNTAIFGLVTVTQL